MLSANSYIFWNQGAILREFHDSNIECNTMHSVNTIKFTLQRLHHWVGDLVGFRGYLGVNAKKKSALHNYVNTPQMPVPSGNWNPVIKTVASLFMIELSRHHEDSA